MDTIHSSRGRSTPRAVRGFLGGAALVATCFACASPSGPIGGQTSARSAEHAARAKLSAGRFAEAGNAYKSAARLARTQGDADLAATCLLAAGDAYVRAREPQAARLSLVDAVGALEALRSDRQRQQRGLLRAHTGLGDLDFQAGHHDSARAQYSKALSVASGKGRDEVLRRLALLAQHVGDVQAARSWRARILDPDPGADRRLELAFGTPGLAPLVVAAPTAAYMPPVLPRSSWGASSARANQDPMGPIWRMTVHHSGQAHPETSRSGVAQSLRAIQKFHVQQNSWADIGYHFLIDSTGRVWQGRPLKIQGAHAGSPSLNEGNVGISLLGDFSRRLPGRAQMDSLVQVMRALASTYSIGAGNVYTHRDIRPTYTECPGNALQAFVEDYRRGGGRGLAELWDEADPDRLAWHVPRSPVAPAAPCACCCAPRTELRGLPGTPRDLGEDGSAHEAPPGRGFALLCAGPRAQRLRANPPAWTLPAWAALPPGRESLNRRSRRRSRLRH